MIIALNLKGRFGNVVWKLFNVFKYALNNNISYNNIIIHNVYFKYIIRNISFFNNFRKHFVNDVKYKELQKNNKTIYFKDFCFWKKEYNILNNEDLNLFGKLFYNEELYRKIISKSNIDHKKYVALHIRRTDFKRHFKGLFYQDIQTIIERISKYKNVLIFTDDKKWFIDNIKENNCIIFDDNGLKPYEIFINMCMCSNVDYHIGSTYSQCAKYMNNFIYNKGITSDLNNIVFK